MAHKFQKWPIDFQGNGPLARGSFSSSEPLFIYCQTNESQKRVNIHKLIEVALSYFCVTCTILDK